jgi:23S rRNA (uracil747-C5)-methyltransferase
VRCDCFDRGECSSCTLLGRPYTTQLAAKESRCRDLLGHYPTLEWLPAAASRESGFRNKAKMAVGGTALRPVLGILDPGGRSVDLRDCPLHADGLRACLPVLAAFVTRANLTPYDVASRRGELKYLLVTQSPDDELMVRFVLRSQEPVARLRKHLPWLLATLPRTRVVSVNLQPEHKAVLEGDEEILLTEDATLPMRMNGVDLLLRPQGFFQTNTEVAAALYRQAREWVDEVEPTSVWDLYCGVGGFALHCADGRREVVGVETSPEAVAGARLSAQQAGLGRVTFRVGDATAFATSARHAPDLVIVNPPRRGIGAELAGWLESCAARAVIYSSCNVGSLARDLAAMPSLSPRRARLFDMFPQTDHAEVAVLLGRDRTK